jgi:hypothetical protein
LKTLIITGNNRNEMRKEMKENAINWIEDVIELRYALREVIAASMGKYEKKPNIITIWRRWVLA